MCVSFILGASNSLELFLNSVTLWSLPQTIMYSKKGARPLRHYRHEALSAVSADSHRTCRGQFTSGQCQVAGRLDSSGTEHSTTPTRHHHTHHTHHSPQSPPRSEKVSQTDRQKGKRVLTVIAIFSPMATIKHFTTNIGLLQWPWAVSAGRTLKAESGQLALTSLLRAQ